jgi:hypothetical protein
LPPGETAGNPVLEEVAPTNLVVVETTGNTPVETNDFTISIANICSFDT